MINDNSNLMTHVSTDPNAVKHASIGLGMFIIGIIISCALSNYIFLPLLLPLISGITIEVIQRFQGGKNTTRESIMDILTTWLWPVYYIQLIKTKGYKQWPPI